MEKKPSKLEICSDEVLTRSRENIRKEPTTISPIIENAFLRDFPESKKIDWYKINDLYEGCFCIDDLNHRVLYSNQGILEEYETEIEATNLPLKAVVFIVRNRFGKIEKAGMITKSDGSVLYTATVKTGNAFFDEEGHFLKKT